MEELVFERVYTPAQVQETAQLADTIWHECYTGTISTEQIDYMIQNLQSPLAIAQQMEVEGYEYYLLQKDGQTVGYLGVQPKEGKLFLSKVYLLAQWRGKALTGPIFSFADDLARRRDCTTLWLTVNRHNARAVSAYKKRGFATVREQVADIGGGFVMDDYVMERAVGANAP